MATLRALEAASLPQQPPSLPGSDSEEEEEVVKRKKKRPKKASSASVSTEVEVIRKKKCQKQGPHGRDSEEREEESENCWKGDLVGSESVAEEKRKKKWQQQASSKPAQHPGSVDYKGTIGCVCGRGWGWGAWEGHQLILHQAEVTCHH